MHQRLNELKEKVLQRLAVTAQLQLALFLMDIYITLHGKSRSVATDMLIAKCICRRVLFLKICHMHCTIKVLQTVKSDIHKY